MANAHPTRREWIRQTALLGTSALIGKSIYGTAVADTIDLPFVNGQRPMATFPQKRPLILLTRRPPQLETPFSVYNESIITPNDAFFVRYHLANIPLKIDDETYRLSIKGSVKTSLELSLADLKTQFEQVSTTAVCQCSGNSRGFFKPRVGGGQLGHGAMGNATWVGVRLKDVLEKAGLATDAKQVSFNGLDTPAMEKTPDFVKSLDVEQALDGEIILAHTMNGEPLPFLNGFPLRLVVPGYYGTYWLKHLHEITVLSEPFTGFWMATGYRIPANEGACVEPGTAPKSTIPINRMNVRSFITSHENGARLKATQPVEIKGFAFDGGEGIKEVLFSQDGGQTWITTKLGNDLGKYSFREWTQTVTPKASKQGSENWMVRAVNRIGQTQPMEPLWNPAGYMRNVVENVQIHLS